MNQLSPTPPSADQIRALAAAPILLVVCDFDGTLAPIVDHPNLVVAEQASLTALTEMSELPQTFAGVISGRSLQDLDARLSQRLGERSHVRLIGSHGEEWSSGSAAAASGEMLDRLSRVRAAVSRVTDGVPGAWVEIKPLGIAVHYRQAGADDARVLLERLEQISREVDGVRVMHGKRVVEFLVGGGNKGLALLNLRHATGATNVLFIGDDVTDEDAFGVLTPHDLAVKVGPGESRAGHRVDTPADVAAMLGQVLGARREHLQSRRLMPIDGHRLLSDQRSAGLVDATGRVVWLCMPRIDSPPIFAELLGGPSRGFWEVIGKDCPSPPVQRWVGSTFVLETEWSTASQPSDGAHGGLTPGGQDRERTPITAPPLLRVTDYLDTSMGRGFQRSGRSDLVRVLEGTGWATVRFAPRHDFARVPTRLRAVPGGLEVTGGHETITLWAPDVQWMIVDEGPHQTAIAEINLQGRTIVMELRYGTASVRPTTLPEPERRRQSLRSWSSWAASLQCPALYREHVERSALVLRALCHGPSGAIAAAATTSLPEQLGGVRNWDYRYCWPRDAAMSAAALVRLGNTGVAMRLLDYIAAIVANLPSPERLRPIYDVAGHDLGSEAEISELSGYAQSRPVRIGNAAAMQVQLDVFGPIVDLAALVAERGAPVTPEVWRLVEAMVRAVAARWREPDHGVWEVRAAPRHHVHSRIMCYHAIDRALVVADLALGSVQPEWVRLRDEIEQDILLNAWSDDADGSTTAGGPAGAFVGYYGGKKLDAAVLLLAGTGLLPNVHDRFARTVDAINTSLRRGSSVLRYSDDDGLSGEEGGMIICAFWLVEALASVGRLAEARSLLDQIIAKIADSGLMSEQVDRRTGAALGNFPQAYSHLGLINAVLRLERAGFDSRDART